MITVKLTVTGASLSDIEDAIDEAKKGILAGCSIGYDSNDTGSYEFNSEGEDEEDSQLSASDKYKRIDDYCGQVPNINNVTSDEYAEHEKFKLWMHDVEDEVVRLAAVSCLDLADYCYRDAFGDDIDAKEVARDALEEDGFPTDYEE